MGGLWAGQKAFSFQTFAPDHLMVVKKEMHIFDQTTFNAANLAVVDQIPRGNQNL